MLPNSPRAIPGGLPSGPRSRSIGPSRPENARRSDSQTSFSSRHVRSQRSLASLPRESTRVGPPPSLPLPSSEVSRGWQRKHTPQSPQSSSSYDSTSSRISQDSTSTSSVSSIFDRVRNGAASYASSFTSVEDSSNELDAEDPRGRPLQKQRVFSPERGRLPESDETESADTGTGDGYTVWNRVAAAASTLTVSVSKAWAANLSIASGEETPPGQESRLTRAMKAYHIEKARDPSELPAFLFSEHERQPRKRSPKFGEQQVTARHVRSIRGREDESGLRTLRAPEPNYMLNGSINHNTATNDVTEPFKPTHKGTDRLKALREAKRSPTASASVSQVAIEKTASKLPQPKVGLPSTPGPRRR